MCHSVSKVWTAARLSGRPAAFCAPGQALADGGDAGLQVMVIDVEKRQAEEPASGIVSGEPLARCDADALRIQEFPESRCVESGSQLEPEVDPAFGRIELKVGRAESAERGESDV